MRKHLLERFKKYKWAFLGLLGIIIFAILLFFNQEEIQPTSTAPVITTEPKKGMEGSVYFITAIPPSGYRETPDNFATVTFEFSMPIELSSIEIVTKPYISLERRVYKETPNKLSIWPATSPWKDDQEYTLIIRSLKATSGERLESPITYTYYNKVPEKVYGGEDWVPEGVDYTNNN